MKKIPNWLRGGFIGLVVLFILIFVPVLQCQLESGFGASECFYPAAIIFWYPAILVFFFLGGALVFSVSKSNLNLVFKGALIGAIVSLLVYVSNDIPGGLDIVKSLNHLLTIGSFGVDITTDSTLYSRLFLKLVSGLFIGALIGFLVGIIKSMRNRRKVQI